MPLAFLFVAAAGSILVGVGVAALAIRTELDFFPLPSGTVATTTPTIGVGLPAFGLLGLRLTRRVERFTLLAALVVGTVAVVSFPTPSLLPVLSAKHWLIRTLEVLAAVAAGWRSYRNLR